MQASTKLQNRFQSNGSMGLVIVIALAIGYITWLFPGGFISGQGPYWRAQNEDITQYLSGFWFFIQEPWAWPLWKIQSLNWPSGTLSTFVDIIPLYAAFFKTIHWLFGGQFNPPFNPFGYWVGICLSLQAIGAWWLLKEARVTCWSCLICFTLLLLTFPLWLMRMGHISLLSQWLILFAYALVIRGWRKAHFPAIAWGTLIVSSFFINIYLCVMVCLLCTSQWPAYLNSKSYRKLLMWPALTCALLALGVVLTMWPLPNENGQLEPGFGIYSLNLFSPIAGGLILGKWFSAASPEQAFEGFNYWGLGLLLIFISAYKSMSLFWRQRPMQTRPIFIAQLSLFALLALVTAYALSNQIYIGTTLVYQWNVPDWAKPLTGQLRASGRFFWIVSYALLIFSFIAIARTYSPRTKNILFCVVLSSQLVDIWPYLSAMRHLNEREPAVLLNSAQWAKGLSTQISHLYFFPKFKCAAHSLALNSLLPVQQFAAQSQRTINTAYIARYNPQCQQEAPEIANSDFEKSAYIFVSAEYSPTQIEQFFPTGWKVHCQVQDFATLCTKSAN